MDTTDTPVLRVPLIGKLGDRRIVRGWSVVPDDAFGRRQLEHRWYQLKSGYAHRRTLRTAFEFEGIETHARYAGFGKSAVRYYEWCRPGYYNHGERFWENVAEILGHSVVDDDADGKGRSRGRGNR